MLLDYYLWLYIERAEIRYIYQRKKSIADILIEKSSKPFNFAFWNVLLPTDFSKLPKPTNNISSFQLLIKFMIERITAEKQQDFIEQKFINLFSFQKCLSLQRNFFLQSSSKLILVWTFIPHFATWKIFKLFLEIWKCGSQGV